MIIIAASRRLSQQLAQEKFFCNKPLKEREREREREREVNDDKKQELK